MQDEPGGLGCGRLYLSGSGLVAGLLAVADVDVGEGQEHAQSVFEGVVPHQTRGLYGRQQGSSARPQNCLPALVVAPLLAVVNC